MLVYYFILFLVDFIIKSSRQNIRS